MSDESKDTPDVPTQPDPTEKKPLEGQSASQEEPQKPAESAAPAETESAPPATVEAPKVEAPKVSEVSSDKPVDTDTPTLNPLTQESKPEAAKSEVATSPEAKSEAAKPAVPPKA